MTVPEIFLSNWLMEDVQRRREQVGKESWEEKKTGLVQAVCRFVVVAFLISILVKKVLK